MKYKNNPFNIRKGASRWLGSISKKGDAFESFDTLEHGVRAFFIILRTYALKYGRCTPRSIITRFAPSSENDVDSYIKFVCDYCNSSPDDVLHTASQYYVLAFAMAYYESKTKLTYGLVFDVWKYYHIRNDKFPYLNT